MIEHLEFIDQNKSLKDIKLMSEHTIDLLLMSLKLHAKTKIPEILEKQYNLFIDLINNFKNNISFYSDNLLVIAHDKNFELTLYPNTNGNIILNFGYIEEFPPQQLNVLYSVFGYFLGYYIGIKTIKESILYVYDIINIFIGLFLQIFGRSHALLTFSDDRIEKIKLLLAIYIFRKILHFKSDLNINHYIPEIKVRLSLKHLTNYQINFDRDEFDTLEGTFKILNEQKLINVSKDIYVYRVFNVLSPIGLTLFESWERFCGYLFSTLYPSYYSNSYLKRLNILSYKNIFNFLYNKIADIDNFSDKLF